MRRSDPPDAASISPTGTSPSRWAGSEMAQPSIMLIRVQLRSARVRCRKSLVVGEIGDARRRVGGGRQNQRVVGSDAFFGARDQRAPRAEEIDIVGRTQAFAAQNTAGDAGIVDLALAGDQIAVPGIAFSSRETALGAHRRDIEKLRHLDPFDDRALPRQRLQRTLEGLRHRLFEIVERD